LLDRHHTDSSRSHNRRKGKREMREAENVKGERREAENVQEAQGDDDP
jgi:hypothetical protein